MLQMRHSLAVAELMETKLPPTAPPQNHLHGHDIDGARPRAHHQLLKVLGIEVHAADAGLCSRRRLGWAEGHQAVAALGIPHAHCGITGSRDHLQSVFVVNSCQQPQQLQVPANLSATQA